MLPGLAFCFFIVYIVDMEKYDYYTIKAAWKGAGVSQRADDIKAAEKIAADLKGNGFLDVVIFGVKAGKREKLEGGKQDKPKAQERPRKAKKPKEQAKADPKVKTRVKASKKREEKAQDNGGQLDLFNDFDKKNIWSFSDREINYIKKSLYEQFESGRSIYGLKNLLTNFEKLNARQKIELTNREITNIYESLLNYRFKHNFGATGTTFFEISRLMETLKNGV